MASGPWDNVQLQGPPNGPAWSQAAAQMMGAVNGAVNNSATAFRNMSDWGYQQQQRNLFQNGLPTDAKGQPDRAAIIDQLIKSGGAPTAQALLPSIQQQPFRDLYLKRLQQQNNPQSTDDSGVNTGSPNPTTNTAVSSILGNNAPPASPRTPYGMDGSGAPNLNILAANYNIPQPALNTIAKRIGASSSEDDLNPGQVISANNQIKSYLASVKGGTPVNNNPVAQSGGGDQEAASSNQLNPSTGEQTSAITPRQGPERRVQTAAEAPANFNNRFDASYGNPPVGAAATVPPQYRNDPNKYLQILRDRANRKNQDAQLAKLAGFDGTADEKAAEAINKQADELQKRIGEDVSRTGEQKGFLSGTAPAAKRKELQQTRYDKQESGIQASDRAAFDSDEDMRAMRGILNDPKLFTMGGNELVAHLRGALINAGLMDPNARLPNEALKKITAKAMQAQIAEMRDDAAQMGGSANKIMLAQVRIMQDAAQNPDMSPSGLRYLTEVMERANARTHDIAQLARDYNKQNGNQGLDEGFDQKLADYNRSHPMMTEQEIEHHQLLSAPHLPDSLTKSGAGEVARWAHQQGLKTGDPIRIGNTNPPVYKPAP